MWSFILNLRAAVRRLLCTHPHWDTYNAQGCMSFGMPYRDGMNHAISLRGCLRCGAIRLDSITSSREGS